MFCFQLSLLLFKSIPFSHHLYTRRRAEESHSWQLVSSRRQGASLEGGHPLIHPNSTCTQSWLSMGLSSPFVPPSKAFSAAPPAQSQALVSRVSSFSVSLFASRNIPVVPARLLSGGRGRIQVALFPYVPADTRVSQQGALAGGHGLCTLAIVTWHWP